MRALMPTVCLLDPCWCDETAFAINVRIMGTIVIFGDRDSRHSLSGAAFLDVERSCIMSNKVGGRVMRGIVSYITSFIVYIWDDGKSQVKYIRSFTIALV